ncbi:MAG: Asp/Glu/hydantoin racemase [Bacteroidetes bacterium]|jgi:glutamate racemase|nr:Asp/Glu/hydantoin racemase [Bacteroidota bacterium]
MKNRRLFFSYTLLCVLILFSQCKNKQHVEDSEFSLISTAISNTGSKHYFNPGQYPVERSELAIGVFDSGTGGLSVLNSIIELDEFNNSSHEPGSDGIADFISERFIYLADEANMPYGKYNAEGKADFLRELVLKDVLFLLGNSYYSSPQDRMPKKDKGAVKSIVIACNTATAYGLETVRDAMNDWDLDIEILGIIEAGAKNAIELLSGRGKDKSVIGVLATEGTCASGGYPASILKIAKHQIPEADIMVVQQAGIGLAGAIDEDINYIDPSASEIRDAQLYYGPGIDHSDYPIDLTLWDKYNFKTGNGLLIERDEQGEITRIQINSVLNYIRYMLTHLVIKSSSDYPDYSLDAVILGCTHYPYFESDIREHLLFLKQLDEKYERIIPENIALINPAQSLAIELYKDLVSSDLTGKDHYKNSSFFISVPNSLLKENNINELGEFPYSWKYGREINSSLQYVKVLPFSDQWIDANIRMRIKQNLLSTYNIIYPEI